ncbi:GPI ethanolamine phosphate transferase 1 [Zancudomyces culisetae]|uniref:GPI ethanolamine phosphate transferase 1 n=1 Tax=Zancudomyces culisetae TaxID=1213189 RepID=A0A1R1PLU6_ZANCU|nr:GPI ethanolamine phosphate transferase 1 [Zancudomyces culisetae]|eukprot:OMH81934.1 GPI ethanolamine phosphate transferase 1 [Zancudomyces culisetae]
MRKLIETEATFGVSHTRVPTESRPGHVALIAGFYEDVSAVTKGWKMNPVKFDSLINQTRYTWSFGSPDILPMFAEGATDKTKVETIMYGAESEDFGGAAWHLDEFVYLKVKEMFETAKVDGGLRDKLNKDKIVIFMHMLGLDTNGHAFRPTSREYLDNIGYVDKIVQDTVKMVDEFYGHDGKTTYVFSADHGMEDHGVHGDGHPDNTRTPLVAWGAGINKPVKGGRGGERAKGHDEFSENWGLDQYERNDVNQADIAPLMSSMLGIPLPMNSVGKIPLSYLSGTDEFKAQALYANARQIAEQFKTKEREKKKYRLSFVPFEASTSAGGGGIDTHLLRISQRLLMREYKEAISLSEEVIQLGLDGLSYYQKYDWILLKTVITLGYLGWMAFSAIFIIENYVLQGKASREIKRIREEDKREKDEKQREKEKKRTGKKKWTVSVVDYFVGEEDYLPSKEILEQQAKDRLEEDKKKGRIRLEQWGLFEYVMVISVFVVLSLLLYVQNLPYIYYAYIAFPYYFWIASCKQLSELFQLTDTSLNFKAQFKDLTANLATGVSNRFGQTIPMLVTVIALEMLVYTYYERRVYTVILLLMGFSWPFVIPKSVIRQEWKTVASFTFFCCATSVFTLLPVKMAENQFLCLVGGFLITGFGVFAMFFTDSIIAEVSGFDSSLSSNSSSKSSSKPTARYTTAIPGLEPSKSMYDRYLLAFQSFLVFAATLVVYSTSCSLQQRKGLPLFNQILAWLLFAVSILPIIVFPRASRYLNQHFICRLFNLFLAFAVPMVLLTISFESLFYFCFFGLMMSLLILEQIMYRVKNASILSLPLSYIPISAISASTSTSTSTSTHLSAKNSTISSDRNTYRPISYSDLRISIMFLMFINLAFFGTGNLASISSFYLESVYRLITTFSPFFMTFLLLLKIFIPFLLVSSIFVVLNTMRNLPDFCLFLLALSTTDLMTLNFFFNVRDEGSWLDIGTSISHFCISSLSVLFSTVLFVISYWGLIGNALVPVSSVRKHFKSN